MSKSASAWTAVSRRQLTQRLSATNGPAGAPHLPQVRWVAISFWERSPAILPCATRIREKRDTKSSARMQRLQILAPSAKLGDEEGEPSAAVPLRPRRQW